ATDVAAKAPLRILSMRVSRKESNERKGYVPVHFSGANGGTVGAGSQTEVSNAGQQSAVDMCSVYDVAQISGRDIVQRRLRGYGQIRWVGHAAKAKTPGGRLLPIEPVWYELGKQPVSMPWLYQEPETKLGLRPAYSQIGTELHAVRIGLYVAAGCKGQPGH